MLGSKLRLLGVAAIAVLTLTNWLTLRSNGDLREHVGALELALKQASAANEANVVTLNELIALNNACVDGRRIDEQAGAATVTALNQDLSRLRARRTEREEIYRDPSCAELGAIDIAAVCPVLATSVRERARGLNSDRGP